ncbi:hypothetical protein [Paraburkholderia ferrariae]|uniref:hypothetical protein n=1 Tax=Paraburkholderia ferrariae TaxID=386056 RepID=UPI0004879F6C|nr:hypothetical protein [Paraburkholderia ferrariae]
MSNLKRCIETYIFAKDGNRPHLMEAAFAPDAQLTTQVATPDIVFPPHIAGCEAITAIMVSQFAQRYENVYTFCLSEPQPGSPVHDCNWLVCMTEKESGAARLGYGRYEWRSAEGRITALTITIEEMRVLDRAIAAPMLTWAHSLPYPWCTVDQLEQAVPPVEALERVIARLRTVG